jgi:hypothetical protein
MQTLKRRPYSGFVPYPKNWERRVISGRATFQTKCDMLIGPCACGYTHRETDCWVDEALEQYDAEIEPLILRIQNGEILLPKYWEQVGNNGKMCSHLVGPCACGTIHLPSDKRTRDLLRAYMAVIE